MMTEKEREAIERLGHAGRRFTARELAEALTGGCSTAARTRAMALLRRLQAGLIVEPQLSEPDGTPGRPPLLWRLR